MKYVYYPGCTLETSAKPYDISLKTVFERLGCELVELDDWNCCGATAYMSVKETIAFSISARNLALAEAQGGEIVAPCSSCFTIPAKTARYMRDNPLLRERVCEALHAGGLKYQGRIKVRHPLDALVNDIGIEVISSKMVRDLRGIKIANYYGCQIVRPERGFDDRENPMTIDDLFSALGAENVYFPTKVRCCGGMLTFTFTDVGLKLNRDLLQCATENGADVIVTTCPMCQMNLEGYQGEINRKFRTRFRMPIMYFTQLLGWALGADEKELGLDYNLVPLAHEVLTAERTR